MRSNKHFPIQPHHLLSFLSIKDLFVSDKNKAYIRFLLEVSSMTAESALEKKIMQCVDDGLEVLGDGGKKAIYYYLEKNLRLKQEEIPKKPKIFCRGLTLMFGGEGAGIIEKWIIEKLKMSFDLKQQSKITFAKAIDTIKARQKKCLDSFDCK